MRLSANRIRSINRTLASINGRSLYNENEPLAPAVGRYLPYARRLRAGRLVCKVAVRFLYPCHSRPGEPHVLTRFCVRVLALGYYPPCRQPCRPGEFPWLCPLPVSARCQTAAALPKRLPSRAFVPSAPNLPTTRSPRSPASSGEIRCVTLSPGQVWCKRFTPEWGSTQRLSSLRNAAI